MGRSVVLTLMGEDRPGLVEQVADTVAGHDGNWLESRMAHLAGKFAGILRVEVPSERLDSLLRSLEQLDEQGLRVVSETAGEPPAPRRAHRLDLVGSDHPGIVRDISRALARRRVNVEELVTERTDAPMSGQTLFRASAKLRLPEGLTVDQLGDELESVAHDLMVDITLEANQGE